MSASTVEYAKMFGEICESAEAMARCACVACNSCTCACSCRNVPDDIDLSKITKIEVNSSIKKELSLFIDDYYERYSGLYLKSKTLLETFNKIE